MKGLRLQDGCHNCRHRFVMQDYDAGPETFCQHEGGRPPCLSLAMDGEHGLVNAWMASGDMMHGPESKALSEARDTWYAWSRPRRVEPAHICDMFEAT